MRGGLTSELDVTRAAALLANTQAQLPVLETLGKQTVHRLSVLLGQAPGATMQELAAEAPIPGIPQNVAAGLPSELLRRRPDVRRAERQIASATARVGVEVAELFPKFSLLGTAGLQSLSAGDWLETSSRY